MKQPEKGVSCQTGKEARAAIRAGKRTGPTAGLAPGHIQSNLVVLDQEFAWDFVRFCIRNPKPCPLLDVTEPGSPVPASHLAEDADLRYDLPLYRVYEHGEMVAEVTDIAGLWTDGKTACLLGCSFSFEHAILRAGIPMRHLDLGCNVPMFRTNIQCVPAGIFKGPMVVSMRPIPAGQVEEAVRITATMPFAHGGPVHIGDPERIGIIDLLQPDYGDGVPVEDGEMPVFWACGVTPQAIASHIKLPVMITHAPGHMFILDTRLMNI